MASSGSIGHGSFLDLNRKIPAEISEKLFEQSKEWAILIAEELKYIGTLCVEYFIDRNDNLYVNEIAPRVHNSGHLTINAYNVSQFENHVRAVCSLDQVPLKKISNAEICNESIIDYLGYSYIPAPKTMFKNIFNRKTYV